MLDGVDYDEQVDEWKVVALVMNRLLLWMFSLYFIIGTFVIFIRMPKYR